MAGLFVAFEGGEGVGKSTQLELAAQALREAGHDVLETREPGGTPMGREVRALLLDRSQMISARAEALLYAADRAQHVETVLRPALDAGQVVLTDRYVDSTLAYQGAGRGLHVYQARVLTDWASDGLVPDLTILLDADPQLGLQRALARSEPDRLEAASLEFHQAARSAFLTLANEDPTRYAVIDAAREQEQVTVDVIAALNGLLSRG